MNSRPRLSGPALALLLAAWALPAAAVQGAKPPGPPPLLELETPGLAPATLPAGALTPSPALPLAPGLAVPLAPGLEVPLPGAPAPAPPALLGPAAPSAERPPEAASPLPAGAAGLGALDRALQQGPETGRAAVLDRAWDLSLPRGAGELPGPQPLARAPGGKAGLPGLERGPLQNFIVQGLPSGMNRLVEGEVLFWDPKGRELDPYIAGPHDDKNMVHAKVRNEVEGLRRVWLDVREAVSGRVPAATLARGDQQVALAAAAIERDTLKAEVVLERLGHAPEADFGDAAVQAELVLALRSRPTLLYLTDDTANMTLETFHADLKRLAKDRVMVKVFDRFLRLLYGLDAKDAAAAHGERMNAYSRRMTMGEFLPMIADEIDAGRTPEQALGAALADLHRRIETLKVRIIADRKSDIIKKNLTFLEEIAAGYEAVRDGLRAYDYVYEQSDLPEIARAKKEAEFARFKETWARALKDVAVSADLKPLLADLAAHMRAEVLGTGRGAQYAAAEFYYRNQGRVDDLNAALNEKDGEGPLDLLMRYSHSARGGAVEANEDRDLVVVARRIRDEADYQDLRLSFREHGRVVAVATVGSEDRQGASRMPHWVIFAKADGIVPLPWARFDAGGAALADLAKRLERPGGRPGTALVNGRRGQAVVNPDAATRGEWLARAHGYARLDDYYKSRALRPASFAGAPVRFLADEADPKAYRAEAGGHSALEASGAAGVGLLRMEQLMRELGNEWDPAGLTAALKEMLERPLFKGGAPLIVRLFDFEADKVPGFLRGAGPARVKELLKTHSNARLYLDKSQPEFREFGKMQLKALFEAHRASPGANLRILFSNVRSAREIKAIEELVEEAASEHRKERKDEGASAIPIGYMVEDAATVRRLKPFMAEIARLRAAKPAERFLAFGTNDYQSSLLRGDPDAIEKLSLLDPRLVSGIWAVAEAARAQGLEFTVDGEWGSSPKLLMALLALRARHGVSATSVVYTGRAAELYELARSLTVEDLGKAASGRRGEDLRALLLRMARRRHPPTLAQFDRAVSELVDRVEDRVLSRIFDKPTP